MKPENVAVVFTDADTGKAYAAVLNESETLVIMAMLSGLQDGAIRAREVIPFELRSVPADRIAEKQARLHEAARTGVEAFIGMAVSAKIHKSNHFEYGGTTRGTIGPFKGMDNLPKEPPAIGEVTTCYACNQQVLKREVLAADGFCPLCDAEISDEDEPDDKALCYQCGEETRQRLVGDEWHCKACHAVQCERVRCESCGKTCTRPEGSHYCKGGSDGQA